MSGGILSDLDIRMAVEEGTIKIDPYDPKQLNPASYDLTLGDMVTVYKGWVETESHMLTKDGRLFHPIEGTLDIKKEPETERLQIDPKVGWVLKPGIGYLMHTRERIWTKNFVPIVDGKSSTGRLFILIHFTAGYGDPNFDGQYTLEVSALHPVRIYPGMRIGQIRFHTLRSSVEKPYEGNYVGTAAQGAVASRAWKQFTR